MRSRGEEERRSGEKDDTLKHLLFGPSTSRTVVTLSG